MLAGGRNSRCNSLDYFLLGFFLCARFFLVTPHPTWDIALALVPPVHFRGEPVRLWLLLPRAWRFRPEKPQVGHREGSDRMPRLRPSSAG